MQNVGRILVTTAQGLLRVPKGLGRGHKVAGGTAAIVGLTVSRLTGNFGAACHTRQGGERIICRKGETTALFRGRAQVSNRGGTSGRGQVEGTASHGRPVSAMTGLIAQITNRESPLV